MSYKMKGSPAKLGTIHGTSGHKAALDKASPVKKWDIAGAVGGGMAGAATGGLGGMVTGGLRGLFGGERDYGEWQETLEQEDLDENMWSGTIFGRKRDRERKRRLKELKAKKKLGLDRERISASTGTMAGAASTSTEVEDI